MKAPESFNPSRWKRRATVRAAVGITVMLIVTVAVLPAGRGWVRQLVTGSSPLESYGPSDEAIARWVQPSPDPAGALSRLWHTGKIPHRLYALDHLRRSVPADPRLWPAARPVVLEAARCGDVDIAQAALTVLSQAKDSEAEAVALRLLGDTDPELRRFALQHLARSADKRLVPFVAAGLRDLDPSVRTVAAGTLEELTGQAVSIRFNSEPGEVAEGVRVWEEWWGRHRGEFPDPPAAPAPLPPVTGVATEFALQDLTGQTVRLSDFRGKVVLVNFWATWCPPCLQEIPTLVELHRRYPDRLVILGISTDALGHGHDEEGHSHGSDDPAAKVSRVVTEKGITYPVLIDRDGATVAAYRGEGLPTTVLIDPAGRVHRRFIGARTIEVLEKMVEEADRAEPAQW